MRKTAIILIIFNCIILKAIIIPFSQTELKIKNNHLSDFVRVDPDDSLAILLRTDVWIWHDKDNLHILWEAEINEDFKKGKLANRDEGVNADFMRIQIITDMKDYYSFMFYSYPFGNKYDGIRKSDLNLDFSWNSNYKYKNIISDNLWKSTMTIPLKDLRFYGKPPYNWKIILTRYFQKDDEYYSIPYGTTDMRKDYFRTAHDITINEELSKNINYRITPYFIKKYDLIEETDSFDPDNIGLDFSYNPTSSTKVKFSINPDFSDVPMDAVEDNYNIQYASSYEENRYFFIEDLDVFGISNQLFYSRHIIQPQYAIKLTGNSKKFSYGFLSAMDKEITEDGVLINSDDVYNMLAFRPKWNSLSIQFTLLNRMNKYYHNDVLLINPSWDFIKNHTIWSKISTSFYAETGFDNKKGYSLNFGYTGITGDFHWTADLYHITNDYNADMGRIYKTNLTSFNANYWQSTELNVKFAKKFGSGIWLQKEIDNSNNELLNQSGGINIWVNPQTKACLSINYYIGQENYNNSINSCDELSVNISSWKYSYCDITIGYSTSHTLVYNLNNTYKQDIFSLECYGDLGSYISYGTSAFQIRYFNFPSDSGMDDEYWIYNSDLTLNFSNKFSLTNGLRFNNYDSIFSTAYLGFFSNLRFEFKENCNLYLGYKTVQDEIEQEYITDYKQAYMKVSYTF